MGAIAVNEEKPQHHGAVTPVQGPRAQRTRKHVSEYVPVHSSACPVTDVCIEDLQLRTDFLFRSQLHVVLGGHFIVRA